MKFNVYPYLDKRSMGKDGRHAVKIAIGYDRKADYVNAEVYATPEEWQQLFSEKVPKHLKEAKDKIQATEAKVRTLLTSMIVYLGGGGNAVFLIGDHFWTQARPQFLRL